METVRKLVPTLPDGEQQHFILSKDTIPIGRATTNDVSMPDPKVSRFHARIECDDRGCTIVDLGSANGIRVNGSRVERAPLANGDVIHLGGSTVRFETYEPEAVEPEAMSETTIMEIMEVDELTPEQLETAIGSETIVQTLPDTPVPRPAVHL